MEGTCSSEMSVDFHQTVWSNITNKELFKIILGLLRSDIRRLEE
jgi:hypothetical protein